MSWNEILLQPQAKYPTENFVRFIARNYYAAPNRKAIKFLDIGCGAGANSLYLAKEGFSVLAIDSSPNAFGLLDNCDAVKGIIDITKCLPMAVKFDCILDNNTLCHIENPPMEKIGDCLRDNGIFFSICPTSETWRGHLEGKGYCRCATKREIEDLYSCFSELKIGRASYPDRGHEISSWIVEARR